MKLHLYTGCLTLCFFLARAQVEETTTPAPGAQPQQNGNGGNTTTTPSGTGGEAHGGEAAAGEPIHTTPATTPTTTPTTTTTLAGQNMTGTTPHLPSQDDSDDFGSAIEADTGNLGGGDTEAAGSPTGSESAVTEGTAASLSPSVTPPPGPTDPPGHTTGTSTTTSAGHPAPVSTTATPEHHESHTSSEHHHGASTTSSAPTPTPGGDAGGAATAAHEHTDAITSATATPHSTTPAQPITTATPLHSTAATTATASSTAVASDLVLNGANITQVVCHWSAAELAYCLAALAALSLVQMALLTLCVYRVASRSHTWEPPPIHYSKNPRRNASGRGLHLASDGDCKAGEAPAAGQNGSERTDGGGGGGQRSSDIPILITNEDGWCVPYGDAQDRRSLRKKKTQDTGL